MIQCMHLLVSFWRYIFGYKSRHLVTLKREVGNMRLHIIVKAWGVWQHKMRYTNAKNPIHSYSIIPFYHYIYLRNGIKRCATQARCIKVFSILAYAVGQDNAAGKLICCRNFCMPLINVEMKPKYLKLNAVHCLMLFANCSDLLKFLFYSWFWFTN